MHAAAWRAADQVIGRLADDPGPDISGGRNPYAGLLRGRTGPALMLLRLYELSGDDELLGHAATALRQDLRRCVLRPDGALEVNEGWRTMPYLAHGSVGIGLVLDQYLRHRADDQFAEASAGIRRAARSPFYAQSGLFAGRAGIIAYLAASPTRPTAANSARSWIGWPGTRCRTGRGPRSPASSCCGCPWTSAPAPPACCTRWPARGTTSRRCCPSSRPCRARRDSLATARVT